MDIREVKQFMIQLNEENALKKQLDELSKDTLKSYAIKALIDRHKSEENRKDSEKKVNKTKSIIFRGRDSVESETDYNNRINRLKKRRNEAKNNLLSNYKRYNKRSRGLFLVGKKLANEDVDYLDELSRKTLGSYIVKADKHGSDLALDAGLAFGGRDWKHNETNPEHEENLRKRLKRIKGIKKAVSRLSNENVNEAMISKTAKQTAFGRSIFKKVTHLSKDEKNHIDNGGDVFFDSGRPDNGTNGSTLRRVIKGRNNVYYPRILKKSHHEMIKNMKEDRREFEYKDLVSLNEAYISIFK